MLQDSRGDKKLFINTNITIRTERHKTETAHSKFQLEDSFHL